ncbi:membrane cofactor protein-like isoform 2-T2 [Pangshura tecta]
MFSAPRCPPGARALLALLLLLPPLPGARGRSCKQLELENGRVDLTSLKVGTTATFSCNEGYRLIGTTSAKCVASGNEVDWDKEVPVCQAIPCLPPPDITHGSHTGQSGEEFSFGSAVTYKCDQGFSLIGEASIHCTTKDNVNGEWSGPSPECEGACESPPRFSFAELPGEVNNSYPVGTKLKYSCRSGYTFAPGKSPLVTCLANSTWSADPEFCVGRPCKSLELENGRVHLTDHLFGATANFSCNEGYRLTGPNSVRCVLVESGVDWNKELPRCDAIPCLPPPYIANGFHTGQSEQEFTFGSAVTYKCDQGFSLIGDASIHCTTKNDLNGEWSGPAPECKVVRCPEPEVKNGKKQTGLGPDYSYGNTVIFECDSGYTLTGSNSVKCEANNSWVPFLPTCLSITHTTPTASPPGGTTDTSGKMPIILAVLITNLFIRQ